MSAIPSDQATWVDFLDAVAGHVEQHNGSFPSPTSDDAGEVELAQWWREQNSPAVRDRMSPADQDRLDAVRHRADQIRAAAVPEWPEMLAKITDYVKENGGRFPHTRLADPDMALLGSWWVRNNIRINQQRMTEARRQQLDRVRELARRIRAERKTQTHENARRGASMRALAGSTAAGQAGAEAARQALGNPHLIPGDRDVLQLRIEHPTASFERLAELAGMSVTQFRTKFYGALRRTPNSASPLPRGTAERVLIPGKAAELLGHSIAELSRWADAGLIACRRTGAGHRRYLGAEILRVKELFDAGMPEEFKPFLTTLTPGKAAELLGHSTVELRRWTDAGLIVRRDGAGNRRYPVAEILRVKQLFDAGMPEEFKPFVTTQSR